MNQHACTCSSFHWNLPDTEFNYLLMSSSLTAELKQTLAQLSQTRKTTSFLPFFFTLHKATCSKRSKPPLSITTQMYNRSFNGTLSQLQFTLCLHYLREKTKLETKQPAETAEPKSVYAQYQRCSPLHGWQRVTVRDYFCTLGFF